MPDEPIEPRPKKIYHQHPASKRLRAYSRGHQGSPEMPIKTARSIDHSKRPHHDRLGRPIAPWKPEDDLPPRDSNGTIICGAHIGANRPDKYGDGLCHAHGLYPNGRCKFHGGRTLVGHAHPNYQHGRYSRYLPDRLQEGFIESLNDPNRLASDAEIALLQTRISELIAGLDVTASAASWDTARILKNDMIDAIRRRDAKTQAEKLEQLSSILDKGQSDYQSWDQIGRFVERLRKVKETELKRVQLAQETVTRAQVIAFLQQAGEIIRENVADPNALTRISNGLARLLGPSTGSDPNP